MFGKLGSLGSLGSLGGVINWNGFLPATSSTAIFTVTNMVLQSNNFANASWGKAASGVAFPVVTAATGGTSADGYAFSRVVFPAMGIGSTIKSALYQQPAPQTPGYRYTAAFVIKGAVGGEILWIMQTVDGVTYATQQIVCTTSEQLVFVTRLRTGAVGVPNDNYFQIGQVNADPLQNSVQPARTVYIAQARYNINGLVSQYVDTTTATASANFTVAAPSNIRFRDFTGLTAYAGNPITNFNTKSYNVGGMSNPHVALASQIAGTFFAPAEANQNNPATQADWNQIAICTAPVATPLVWTEPTLAALTNSASGWDAKYMLKPTIVQIGALYFMYYSGQTAAGVSSVGLATATDPINGPWTKYGTVALVSGNGEGTPWVLLNPRDGLYYMYVAVGNSGTTNAGVQIDYWTSADGYTWTWGGVALQTSTADWDNVAGRAGVFDPHVLYNSRGFFEMVWSSGNTTGGFRQNIGYAISADGKTFFKYQAGPIFPGVPTSYVGNPTLFQPLNGTLYMFATWSNAGASGQGRAYTMADH